MQKPTLKALDYAIAARHDSLEAVHVSIDDDATKRLKKDWVKQNIHVKLRILSSPYRDLSYPLIQYIKNRREEHGSEVITVYMTVAVTDTLRSDASAFDDAIHPIIAELA